MKISKNKIFKFLACTMFSLVLCSFMIIYIKEITFLFFLETVVLLDFFLNVLFNSSDRFSPPSFLLISVFLGFLDVLFVTCDMRLVSEKYSIDIYEKSLLLFIVWIIFFMIAYVIKKNSNKNSRIHEVKIIDNIINSVNMNYVLIVSIIIQILIGYIIINTVRAVGGIDRAMNDFSVFKYNDQGYLTTLFPLLSLVSISLYEKKYKKLSFASMAVNFFLIAITGRRGLAINTIIIPFLTYYNYKVKKIENKVIFVILIPIVAFIMIVGNIRNQQINYGSSNGLTRTLTYLTNTIQYGQNIPDMVYKMDNDIVKFQHGKYLFNGVLGMIPRALWTNKPESDNSHITSMVIYHSDITYGKPVGAFGFAYFCYGYFGVVLSGIICGLFSSIVYKWMLRKKNVLPILIYSILIQSFLYITNPDSQTKIITLFVIFIIISFVASIKNGKNVFLKGEKNEN